MMTSKPENAIAYHDECSEKVVFFRPAFDVLPTDLLFQAVFGVWFKYLTELQENNKFQDTIHRCRACMAREDETSGGRCTDCCMLFVADQII